MDDLEEKIIAGIKDALVLDEDVSLVTDIVVAYNFLNTEGNSSWGIQVPVGQMLSTTYYLSDLLHRKADRWLQDSLFTDTD